VIRACPTCGSAAIREVFENWKGEFKGQRYVVPKLRFFACPACGERVYPREAMRRIQAASPAYQRSHRKSA
jgi:YgiT-type zinc finger domain-containing protein